MGKVAKNPVAPTIRRALLAGLRAKARRERKTLPEVCEAWWDEDWQGALRALAAFQERSLNVSGELEHHHTVEHIAVQEISQRIGEMLGEGTDSDSPLALPN